ncbi:hypothetical protein ACIBG8_46700 [Nonomuraea sp. NPDC050556]|uniref:hypothetical protein n=1 Tax=Nonomuraea sp. NPDC050556 TaxID=3364369 RepID=UPI00379653BF
MTDQPYEVSSDLGEDVQESTIAMYQDKFPERHRIDEIDDEADRSVKAWVREEDPRETDAHPDILDESTYFPDDPDTDG